MIRKQIAAVILRTDDDIMGPSGSGKSTLAVVLACRDNCNIIGRIAKSGGKDLELEAKGYDWILKGAAVAM